jgi:hypothetical protein
MQCRNILSVVTEKFMEACLMGKIRPSREYSKFPSFSIAHGKNKSQESYLKLLETALRIWGEIQSDRREIAVRKMSDLADKGKLNFYYEGWCLDENQTLLINEKKYDRIALLYRSGAKCFCRYPIIDFSIDKCFRQALVSLLEYLDHKVIENHKGLRKPMLWKAANDKFRVETSTLLPINSYQTDLQNLRFWNTSGTQRLVIRPSINPKGEVATNVNLFHDWEPI